MSTVIIGCKLPNGIMMSDGKDEVRINGWNQNVIQGADHGITHDVPETLWNAWLANFKDSKLVKGGFIFAHKQEKSVKAEAKEKAAVKSGLEQMKPVKGENGEGKLSEI